MTILSLDPSLRAFGWAIIKDSEFVDGGCIETSQVSDSTQGDSDTAALDKLSQELKKIIDTYEIDLVIFEASGGSKSSRAIQSLAFVKGLVISACIFSNIKYKTISAKAVKKALIGKSDASKDEILEEVRKKFNLFDKKTSKLSKFKVYAIADASATYLAFDISKL